MFDCDGLLVDSAACWERAYAALARAHGRSLDDCDTTALAGASVADAAAALTRALRVPIDERRLRSALRRSFVGDPPPALPGVHALIATLTARMRLAVASNAPLDVVRGVLEHHAIDDAFEVVISAEQTAAHKPAPDVYVEACRRLRVAPCDTIAFEDSRLGAQAARAAGLYVVAVPSAPGIGIDADLTISCLGDPRLFEGLALARERRRERSSSAPTPP